MNLASRISQKNPVPRIALHSLFSRKFLQLNLFFLPEEEGFKEGRKGGVFFLYSSYSPGKSSFILLFRLNDQRIKQEKIGHKYTKTPQRAGGYDYTESYD